jgi:tol-pal system protein YbgF
MGRIVLCVLVFSGLLLGAGCTTVATQKKGGSDKNFQQQIDETNAKLEELNHRLSVLQFMVDKHDASLKTHKKSADSLKADAEEKPKFAAAKSPPKEGAPPKKVEPKTLKDPSSTQESAESLYQQAQRDFKNKDYDQAVALFGQLEAEHPWHHLADNALYWQGEALYAQKKYSEAIQMFNQVAKKYPEGNKVPDALLKAGYAYLALKDSYSGRDYLKKVINDYPFSEAAQLAEKRLQTIAKP